MKRSLGAVRRTCRLAMGKWLKRVGGTICCAVVIAFVGCQKSPYQLAPVHGKVSIDGQPLSQAKVMFAPLEVGDNPNPGKPAFGLLQSDGGFALTTYKENDGAVVGEHWVTVIRLAKKATNVASASTAPQSKLKFSRLTVPYKVNVAPDEDNQIDIKLTSQDVARYGVQLSD